MTEEIKPKEYSLSTEEKELLQNQANLKSQQEYLATLIERDMYIFVNGTVKRRLAIGPDMQISYDIAAGKVYAVPKLQPETDPASVPTPEGTKKD